MRTSPLGMRRPRRRAPLVLLSSLALVVAVGSACSDDGDDEGSTPTTTSPTTATTDGGDESTTTAPAEETTTSGPAATTEAGALPGPGDGAEVALDTDQAEAVIGQLLEHLQAVLAAAKADGDNAETLRAGFSEIFTATEAQEQFDGLNGFGGLVAVQPEPGAPTVSSVTVVGGDGDCVTGTAEIDLSPLMTRPVEALQPYSFRLEPAGAGAPGSGWRLSYMGFVEAGAYTENAACPA